MQMLSNKLQLMPTWQVIKHSIIWFSFLAAFISGCFFGHFWISVFLTVLWTVRIICLRDGRLMLLTAIGALLICGWFWHCRQSEQRLTLPDQANATMLLVIQPDEFRIEKGRIQFRGHLSDGRVIQGQYFSKEKENLQRFKFDKTTSVLVTGELGRPLPATNASEFDYRRYLAKNGVYNTIKVTKLVLKAPVRTLNPFQWWQNKCHELRAQWVTATMQLPATLRLYVQGLFLGWRADDFYETLHAVTDLGLIHLFSISGFHVSWLVNVLSKGLIRLRLTQWIIAWIMLMILPSYFILAGAAPSLFRAVAAAMFGFLVHLLGWRVSSLSLWSFSLIAGLVVYPAILTQFGGQLSYGLAFALLFVGQFKPIKQAILLNLISLPIILYHVYQWHVLTLFVNLLILPIFSVCVFPIVLLAGLFGHSLTGLASAVDGLLNWLTELLNQLAALPGMVVFGQPPIVAVMGLIILTIVLMAQRIKWWSGICLVMMYVTCYGLIHYPTAGEVTFFDIGQGDSFLVTSPRHREITMIDTGGRVNFGGQAVTGRSKALKVSVNYLKSQGIDHIDQLLLSHQDADHVGDITDVLQNLHVKRLYVPLGMMDNPRFVKRIEADLKNTQVISVKAGDHVSGTNLTVVHPMQAGEGTNEDSMVLHGAYGGRKWLFTGDLDRAGERAILTQFPSLTTDVLKLGHHGSKTSSDPEVLLKLQPQLAIISAGRDNRYGHPNQETMTTLSKQQIPFLSTQTSGMIRYRYTKSGKNQWETFLKEK